MGYRLRKVIHQNFLCVLQGDNGHLYGWFPTLEGLREQNGVDVAPRKITDELAAYIAMQDIMALPKWRPWAICHELGVEEIIALQQELKEQQE